MGMEIVKLPVAPNAPRRSHRDKPDYLWAVNGREYVSPVVASASAPYVKMSVPIDDGNEVVGVVTANVTLDALNQSLRQHQGNSAAAYITNQNYEVVAHAEPQSVLTRISNEDLNVALPALKEEKQSLVNVDRASTGEEIVRASARVKDERIKGGWVVVVVQPKKDLLAEARETVIRRLRDRAQKAAEDLKSQSLAHTEAALKKAIQQGNQIERATLSQARKSSERLTQSAVRQVPHEAQRLATYAERQMQTNTQQGIASTNRHITQAAKSATAQAVSKLQSDAHQSSEQAAAMMEHEVRQASREAARAMSHSALAFSLLFLLGALALAVATARSFVQPLSRLADGARDVAHGNYACRVETTAPDVELVQLAEAFNTMAAAVECTRTQLESANRHLFEEKQKLDTIIARMPDGLIVTDAVGRVVVMNAAARRLLDLNEDETLFTEADWQSVVTEIPPPSEAAQRASHGKELCDASPVLSRNGRTIQVSIAPVTDESGGGSAACACCTTSRRNARCSNSRPSSSLLSRTSCARRSCPSWDLRASCSPANRGRSQRRKRKV